MSLRFASCGARARSPTHSRGTSAGYPYWIRSIAVARMQPLVVAPQMNHRSSSREYTHYSLLATVEDLLGVKRLGESANASPMTDLLPSTLSM